MKQSVAVRPGPPPSRRIDLNDVAIFTRVVQTGSFTAAARALDLPKSTVSRKVAELEERIGARLLQRTTRKLGLTDAGRIYFDYGERIVADAEEADRAVANLQATPRGRLRVTAPLSFALLGPVVAEFVARYPEVQLDLMCSDRKVDLVEEAFDVAVRTGRLDDSTLVARPLGAFRRVLVAAPSYLVRRGEPTSPDSLADHATLAFGAGIAPTVWSLHSGDRAVSVQTTPHLIANDLDILSEAARLGVGVALVPEFVASRDLADGKLVHVLPEWHGDEVPLQAVYPTARHLSPKVAAFVELLVLRLGGLYRRSTTE